MKNFSITAISMVLVVAFLASACGGGKKNDPPTPTPTPPSLTLSVSAGDLEIGKPFSFSTNNAATFSLTGNCGTMSVNTDNKGGSINFTNSGTCELKAVAQSNSQSRQLVVNENPKINIGNHLEELEVGQVRTLGYDLTGTNPDNLNVVWIVDPPEAAETETETDSANQSVKITAKTLAEKVDFIATLGGKELTRLTTKIIQFEPTIQVADLGEGRITAGFKNVVANYNDKTGQTSFYKVGDDLTVSRVGSDVAGIFHRCVALGDKVFCGGSTSDKSLEDDSDKAALIAAITTSVTSWSWQTNGQATELADLLVRSNGSIFAATNIVNRSQMQEFSANYQAVNSWYIEDTGATAIPVVAIVEHEGDILVAFSPKPTPESEGYAKYMIFSFQGVYKGNGGDVSGTGANSTIGTLHSMQVIDGDVYYSYTYNEGAIYLAMDIEFNCQSARIEKLHNLTVDPQVFTQTLRGVNGFFQGKIQGRTLMTMTGWNLENDTKTGWIAWAYPDSSTYFQLEGSDIKIYRLLDIGHNTISELTDITGGATLSDGSTILWGYQTGNTGKNTARIVKLSSLVNDGTI